MSFYERKIKFFKSLRLLDTDGDGIKDTIVYSPTSDNYNLQIGIEQKIDDLGVYNKGVNDEFEVVDFGSIWDDNNDGSGDGNPYDPFTGLTTPNPNTTTTGTSSVGISYFCNDSTASNYQPQLVGQAGFLPCDPPSDCCTYSDGWDESIIGTGPGPESINCLKLYTDWGPWNDNLLLNDTNQIYVQKIECVTTFRLINLYAGIQNPSSSNLSNYEGGWYGASIIIEIDIFDGNGWTEIDDVSPFIISYENDINYGPSIGWGLGEKVRIWTAKYTTQSPNASTKYFVTRPYRDITISTPLTQGGDAPKIRVTYKNPTSFGNSDYSQRKEYLRLQIITGDINNPTPTLPNPTTPISAWEWYPSFNNNPLQLLGNIVTRNTDGETFHYLGDISSNQNFKDDFWLAYLGYHFQNNNPDLSVGCGMVNSDIYTGCLPSDTNTSGVPISSFYDQIINILYDFGVDSNESIGNTNYQTPIPCSVSIESQPSMVPSLGNPLFGETNCNNLTGWMDSPIIVDELSLYCVIQDNPVSYMDRDGDGLVEVDENYPSIGVPYGSVDDGLFSKTRYDSPYIFIKPGTYDNVDLITQNELTEVTSNIWNLTSNDPYSPASGGGWRYYRYTQSSTGPFDYKTVSPTCQLGGCDTVGNIDPNLVDQSNSNIFLPQSDYLQNTIPNLDNCASFGTTGTSIAHLWNLAPNDAMGECCSKITNSSNITEVSLDGPWSRKKCSRCHGQLTNMSAQPIFSNATKIAMQTTDSDVYYGPFYDETNPTYNGYGLAFSKANTFCRNIKQKNGVNIYNSPNGTPENELYIGGILHGGGLEIAGGSLVYNTSVWDKVYASDVCCGGGTSTPTGICDQNTKLPLKCVKVDSTTDSSCPPYQNGDVRVCMKCIFCFSCTSQAVQPGIFTGSGNEPTNGISNGITVIG